MVPFGGWVTSRVLATSNKCITTSKKLRGRSFLLLVAMWASHPCPTRRSSLTCRLDGPVKAGQFSSLCKTSHVRSVSVRRVNGLPVEHRMEMGPMGLRVSNSLTSVHRMETGIGGRVWVSKRG